MQDSCRGVWGYPPPQNFQIGRLRNVIFSTCHEICLRKIDLEFENGKQLQVTIIKITESKENKSIQRLDVFGSTVPGGGGSCPPCQLRLWAPVRRRGIASLSHPHCQQLTYAVTVARTVSGEMVFCKFSVTVIAFWAQTERDNFPEYPWVSRNKICSCSYYAADHGHCFIRTS